MWWTDIAMRCIAKLWEGRSAVGSRLGYTKSLWNRARARVSWKKKGVWQQMWSATKSTSGFADPSFGGFWNHLVCAWPFCILNKMVFVAKFFLVDFVFCIVGGLYPARRYLHQGRQSSPPKFQRGLYNYIYILYNIILWLLSTRLYCILVGGLEHVLSFPSYWEFHHPNWRTHSIIFIHFSEG